MTDREAMEAIHALMDGEEWDSDTLGAIGNIVLATGRTIRDPNELA